jgi:lipoate---protein ligase
MKLLDLTLATPAENLALDEALLDAAEAGDLADETLRLWESPQPVVVAGRSSKVALEVDIEACRASRVPVLRRTSGGAAIVAGPGCLMYSVVLRYAGREHLRLIDEVHQHVLGIVKSAIRPLLVGGIEHVGTSDLAIAGQKFSGNSVRCKRDHLLYHGTVLYGFDLNVIGRLLRMPPRQPEYRGGRGHREFVSNVAISLDELKQAIATGFGANQPLVDWPRVRTAELVAARYSRHSWNFER